MRAIIAALIVTFSAFTTLAADPIDITDRILAGGLVELDVGTYVVTKTGKPEKAPLVVRGKGPQLTVITLGADVEHMFHLEGKATGDATRPKNFQYWEFSNLTLNGNGFKGDAIYLKYASLGFMQRVEVRGFDGYALRAIQSYDAIATDCQFVQSGNAEEGIANTLFDEAQGKPVTSTNTNNFTFFGCRWENNPFTQIVMKNGVTKMRFIGCKWHGVLPPLPYNHIEMTDCYDNAWVGCNLTNCGGTAIVMNGKCVDNSFDGVHLGNSRGWGIEANGNQVDASRIIWSTTGGRNRLGNLKP
jgi:hypothetical protein